jgi:hypothetical protein
MEAESRSELVVMRLAAVIVLLLYATCGNLVWAAHEQAIPGPSRADPWLVPASPNLIPHFEEANGRKVLYVDGRPFTVLAVEIPWWDLIYGRYKDTETAYDRLYPAAAKLGLNALKVPIKWSMVEPEKGVYDFSYVDHAKSLAERNHLKLVLNWFGHYASGDGTIYGNLTGELYAPMDIVSDEKTYSRAVDAGGVAHHNAISYDYEPILDREIAAFTAFMRHIREVDSQTHTILMIQVENEIAVFGEDRHNQKLWRDHTAAANRRFAEHHFTDDLKYSAWDLSYNWIRRITDAGAAEYPIPFFHNYVGGKLADWMVGGAPGEDVQTYLENCPHVSFIGVNSYFCAEWRADNSCARESDATVDELREPLLRYRVGRNLPAITEINSGSTPVTSRLAYIAVGEFGAPIYAPWALTVSYPEPYEPYILPDGSEANGAPGLRDTYLSLTKALPQVSYYATTDKLKVFMAQVPGQRFSQTEELNGAKVTVTGERNGQAMVIHPSHHDFLMVGFRAAVSLSDPALEWPAMKNVQVQRVRWTEDHFEKDGESSYGVDQSNKTLYIDLEGPQAVRVTW